jgi:hypothetical protein
MSVIYVALKILQATQQEAYHELVRSDPSRGDHHCPTHRQQDLPRSVH